MIDKYRFLKTLLFWHALLIYYQALVVGAGKMKIHQAMKMKIHQAMKMKIQVMGGVRRSIH